MSEEKFAALQELVMSRVALLPGVESVACNLKPRDLTPDNGVVYGPEVTVRFFRYYNESEPGNPLTRVKASLGAIAKEMGSDDPRLVMKLIVPPKYDIFDPPV